MTNPYKDKKWFKLLGNKYIWVALFFIVWMTFLDNYSYFDHQILNKEIEELKENKKYYQEEIKKDSKSIQELNNSVQIEKFAREKYYMKKENEDIYIIEFEGDSISENDPK